MKYIHVFTFLTILIFVTACNGQVKKDLPQEKEHPKLIKTIGSPGYGNVQCGMQDKAGNLWFGTTENGLYKYDGKSLPTGQAGFTLFIIDEGAMGYMSTNNNAEHILEDKAGNIWFGGRGTEGVYRYDGKIFTYFKSKEGQK